MAAKVKGADSTLLVKVKNASGKIGIFVLSLKDSELFANFGHQSVPKDQRGTLMTCYITGTHNRVIINYLIMCH